MKMLASILTLFSFLHLVLSDGYCAADSKDINCKSKPAVKQQIKHYNIILLGATGNLASKYLWRALFDVYKERSHKNDDRFVIYAASRLDPNDGRQFMSDLLLNLVKCTSDDCFQKKKKFVEAIQYVRLKTTRDFVDLAAKLDENTQSLYALTGSPVSYEEGRLFYMSIPPSAYAKNAKYIDKYLRPKVGRPWVRIVLEKPFGQDAISARKLASELSQYFEEHEMYRIDHYLGKAAVKQILPFRYINKAHYEPLWNKDHIERVDIVMKEKDDAVGRTSFYNDVGIIRDVMQNHLTELLALVAMELPESSGNISDILQSKLRLLRQVERANERTTVTGQYSTYNMEWLTEQNLPNNITTTPTYAASVLYINNNRWQGVPFVLMSGKKLDEKASYVRIKFKNSRFCIRWNDESCNWQKQLVFYIGGKYPTMIAASRGLPAPKLKAGWSAQKPANEFDMFGQVAFEMVQMFPDIEIEPYVELINGIIDGARHLFVSIDSLYASWDIWTLIIELSEKRQPRQYLGRGQDAERLDFVITSNGIYFQLDSQDEVTHGTGLETLTSDNQDIPQNATPSTFRNSTLISGDKTRVIELLAQHIAKLIELKNKIFHIAFSGGNSAAALFERLATMSIPWELVHIWQVDERCVERHSSESNFLLLDTHLLSAIKIPHRNIHPMATDDLDSWCSKDHDVSYEESIRRLVSNESFDFVVLGMGDDGHTASLFPNQSSLEENKRLVAFSETGNDSIIKKRMTLTYVTLNKAENIAILVTGVAKHATLEAVKDSSDVKRHPIVGVKPVVGSLTWYIDQEALFGTETTS